MILIKFEKKIESILILCVFDPYSPLYSLIHDYNLELVSLEIFITHLLMFSMIARIRLVITCYINIIKHEF